MTTQLPAPNRWHSLDSLRAFAMFLGILLHAAMSFTGDRIPFWPAHDVGGGVLADLFIFMVHGFRMQLFFVLAGFFAAMLRDRCGVRGLLVHRLRRVGLPLLICTLTIQPILLLVWMCGDLNSVNVVVPGTLDLTQTREVLIRSEFESLDFLRWLLPLHLWFLNFLLWLCLAMVAIDRIRGRFFREGGGRLAVWFRGVLTSRKRWLVLPGVASILTVPMLLPMADTPRSWIPEVHILAYYLFFFGVGWFLWFHRDCMPGLLRPWKSSLIVANLVVLPGLLGICSALLPALRAQGPEPVPDCFAPLRLLGDVLGASYSWLMIVGTVGLFERYCCSDRAWVRWLSDSSYWCYIMSLIPLMGLQILLEDWAFPGILKFVLINVATMVLLLASYRYLVRYTWIGRILNGPRKRHGVL